MNVLDQAFERAKADPDSETLQMAYYAAFAEAEVFLLLKGDSDGKTAEPHLVDPGTGPMALAFDLEERLAAFVGAVAPFLALSGRQVAEMLSAEGIGLAFNLETPFETAFDAETLGWLAGVTGAPETKEALPSEVAPPKDFHSDLLEAIDRKLAMAAGYAAQAVLAEARFADGSRSHILAVLDCAPDAHAPLSQAIGEAMAFMGFGAGWLDVAFLASDSPTAQKMLNVGLVFDLPEAGASPKPKAPGMDPDNPPNLR